MFLHGFSGAATTQFMNKYKEIFPTRTCLQLKIREVRQKMMAESQQQDPLPPSATSASTSHLQSTANTSAGATISAPLPVPIAVVSMHNTQQQSRIFPVMTSRASTQQIATSASAQNRSAAPTPSNRVTRRAHSTRSVTYAGYDAAQQFL